MKLHPAKHCKLYPYIPEMIPLTKIKTVLYSLSFFTTTLVASAAPLMTFGWGGDGSVAENVDLNTGEAQVEDGMLAYLYSTTTPKSPVGTPAYTGIPLYGAFSLVNNSGTGAPSYDSGRYSFSAFQEGSLRIGATAGEGSGGIVMRGLVFFDRADIVPQATGPITFGEGSSFMMERFGSSTQGSVRQGRAAVYAQVDGDWGWFLSSASSAGSLRIDNAADELWRRYEITESTAPLANYEASSEGILGSAFEDISRFGIWYNYAQEEGKAAFIFIESLSITATAIPEPGAVALWLSAFALLGALWIKRN